MSYVTTFRAAVANVMFFSLYKIFVGRSCSTYTNHSHEPPRANARGNFGVTTAAEGRNDWYGQRRIIARKKRMIRV